MSKMKFKILAVLIVLLIAAKLVLFDYTLSEGRVIGNLTNVSEKKVYAILKSWEGSVDEGSGDKLTTYFSIKDNKLAKELYNYKGKQVILYYKEHIITFPSRSKMIVNKWEPKDKINEKAQELSALNIVGKTLFCAFLGSIRKESDLYNKVKSFVQSDNLYLYKQFSKCND
jgi:hypothetical protein